MPNTSATLVPHDVFVLMYRYLKLEGFDIQTIEQATGVTLNELGSTVFFMKYSAANRLWEKCASLSGDPCFGLSFGRQVPALASGHPFLAMICNCESLEHAIRLIAQYHDTVHSNINMVVREPSPDLLRLIVKSNPDGDASHRYINNVHQVTGLFAMLAELVYQYSSESGNPQSVTIPGNGLCRKIEAAASVAFSCPILISRNTWSITFERDILSTPLPIADALFLKAVRAYLDSVLLKLSHHDLWSRRVAEVLFATEPPLNTSIESTAFKLDVSPRTLQNHLKRERTTYRQIEEDFKRNSATFYLDSTHFSIGTVADKLGYADQSGFTKAFKTWLGVSPSEYRRGSHNDNSRT